MALRGSVARVCAAVIAATALLAPAGAGAAGAPVLPYQANDYASGGFHDILPPGTNGLVNAADLLAFKTLGTRPAHSFDQYGMYRDLLYGSPGLTAADLPKYYKDASFGLKPGDAASSESPRPDVTIVRDKGFGVPHIYGSTREGTMFGLGYVAAEDRLFFMDVLRHAGRAQLSSFAGGSAGNRSMDAGQLVIAPYTEADLQHQIDNFPVQYGAAGQALYADAAAYIAGVNMYINEAKLNPLKMPSEYAATGHLLGPDPWKMSDLVSIASLVGGIFGKGGGSQLAWGKILQSFQQRFGSTTGTTLWADWRERNDPEAPTTVQGQRFPYEQPPANPAPAALPDSGSLTAPKVVSAAKGPASGDLQKALAATTPAAADSATLAAWSGKRPEAPGAAITLPTSDSNALLVSGAHTPSGHPVAVMGPQVAYFDPQILMEEDVHGPGIDATGAAFVGVNLYVELGHGRDYAWSATSAGQDIVHTFAVDLCNADGSAPTVDSTAYVFRGVCTPMSKLSVTNSWTPSLADQTPPGSETLTVNRTVLGPVTARATIAGRPVAYTLARTTYGHEIDSALGFSDFNNPDVIHNASDFQHAAYKIGYTFNWLYSDNQDIAYFNSGNNPVHDPRVDPILPVPAQYEWQNFNPSDNTAAYTPYNEHPQALNQDFITSWNNKQALDYNAADGFYGSIYRSQPLDDRIRAGIANGRKMSLPNLVSAMEDAGTVDLRADKNLPLLLDALGPQSDPQLATAISALQAWHADGSHRIDRTQSGTYAHSDAIAILDAWYPLLVQGEFQPELGPQLFSQISSQIEPDNAPNNHGSHLGSAYDNGWYGYVDKDLRDVLGRTVQAPYNHKYCGGAGGLAACSTMLATTLKQAIAVAQDRAKLYSDSSCTAAKRPGDQACFDTIEFRPTGAVDVPLMPWVNRPTYQQAVEIASHRPRPDATPPATGGRGARAACTSRRRITFSLRAYHPRSVVVYVGHNRLRVRSGARARRFTISLKGIAKTRVHVKLVIRTEFGRRVVLHRRYRTCTPSAKSRKPAKRHA